MKVFKKKRREEKRNDVRQEIYETRISNNLFVDTPS